MAPPRLTTPASRAAPDRFSYRLGRIARAHGLGGELLIQLFRPRRVQAPRRASLLETIALVREDGSGAVHTLTRARFTAPSRVVVQLAEVADRNAAEALEGAFVDVDPSMLPSLLIDEADALWGAQAYDVETGRALGRVRELRDNGAQPLLVLGEDETDEVLIPFVPAFIASVEREAGATRVGIRPIPGLLELSASESRGPAEE